MILHLLKTDWQRLRVPILGVWLVLILFTLPWFFHEPGSFSAPFIEEQRGSSEIPDLRSLPLLDDTLARYLIHSDNDPARYLVAASVLLLSTAIGMHGLRWQFVSPVRPWEKIAAKLGAILVFIVGPQILLGALVLLLLDFSLFTILAASVGTVFSLTFLHAAVAFFAYRCGSVWVWAAASAALLVAIFLISPLLPGSLSRSLTTFTDPWAAHRGPASWAFVATAVIALAVLPGRRRPGSVSAVTSAAAAIVLASVAFQYSPSTALIPSAPALPAEVLATIEPRINPGSVEINYTHPAPPGKLMVEVPVNTSGKLPPGTFVAWSSPPPPWTRIHFRDPAFPLPHADPDRAALAAALPAPLIPHPSLATYNLHGFAEYRVDSPDLHLPARGLVFRYHAIAEMHFSLDATTTTDGSATLVTRRYASTDSTPILEASSQSPALGISTDRTRLSWRPNLLDHYRFVLHLPRVGLCIPLHNVNLANSSSPIPGGAAWSRQLLKPNPWPRPFDLRDARLIILKPVVLAEIEREITVPREGVSSPDATGGTMPGPIPDWQLSRKWRLSFAAYLKDHRPFRPDPATCTAEEFARYLRAVSNSHFPPLIERDLAEYAPRFSRLLALHSLRNTAAGAIARGTPESERDAVLGVLRENPDLASLLAGTLIERDWHEEVPGPLLQDFIRHHSVHPVYPEWDALAPPLATGLALLEDPATYPALLAALEKSRSFGLYQIIRPLPGIDPVLEETIGRISRDLSPGAELARAPHLFGVFNTFKVPVSHGNPIALSKLLELWRMIPVETSRFGEIQRFTTFFEPEPAIPDTIEAWNSFIAGKTPTDFTYDPLTRKWHAPSGKP